MLGDVARLITAGPIYDSVKPGTLEHKRSFELMIYKVSDFK
jgi:hypothetical protein